MTRADRPSFVYFIAPVDGGMVKIGHSYQPSERLYQFMGWSPVPLVLLGSVPAPAIAEWQVHAEFAHLRSHSEWFRAGPDLMAFIETALATGKLPLDVMPDTARRRTARDLFRVAAQHGIAREELASMMGLRASSVCPSGMGGYEPSHRAYLTFLKAARERGLPITVSDLYEVAA